MTNLHLPNTLEQFYESFQHTDPKAWIVLVLAIGSMVAIFAAFFSH
jgi:hypothetical protein